MLGEHTVLFGSQALSIPFNKYSGEWSFQDGIDMKLMDLADKLDDLVINTSLFKEDCEKGLLFKSSIPQQFGLGSSGALTAAIYKSYAFELQTDNTLIQNELAKIESIFHGQSSGTDAMVSFLNSAIHSKHDSINILDESPIYNSPFKVYLFNSSISRSAKTYINKFEKLVESSMLDMAKACHMVDTLIDAILCHQNSSIWDQLAELSRFQFDHLASFIPDTVKSIWEKGLETRSYYLKLCGAGGGGYFLVFSKNDILNIYPDKLIYLNNNQ